MNWFEKHLNWTTGIFGHVFVFIIISLYLAPSFALGRWLVGTVTQNIADFRTPEYPFYYKIFTLIYFILLLILYFGINAWYLSVKGQSYRYLLWLLLPFVLISPVLASSEFGVDLDTHLTGVLYQIFHWASIIITTLAQPIWFGLVAFMLLRLKNHRA
jgi:hypothetical protein